MLSPKLGQDREGLQSMSEGQHGYQFENVFKLFNSDLFPLLVEILNIFSKVDIFFFLKQDHLTILMKEYFLTKHRSCSSKQVFIFCLEGCLSLLTLSGLVL